MRLLLSTIARDRQSPAATLRDDYIQRSTRFTPTTHQAFATEAAFLDALPRLAGRTAPALLLADSRGQQISSQDLAALLRTYQQADTQTLILAIGPADGWSPAARARASALIAFGRITLPHELAAAVAAEQLYRALTILAGHPYHSGH